jgi:uncharacterized membrane protein YvlD (DUF360 family)
MKSILRAYIVNLLAIWLVARYVAGFQLAEGFKSLLIVGAALTVLHLLLRPILRAVLGPLNLLTLGGINILIDAALLFLVSLYFPQITITGWAFPGLDTPFLTLPPTELNVFLTTVVAALIISVIRTGIISLCD